MKRFVGFAGLSVILLAGCGAGTAGTGSPSTAPSSTALPSTALPSTVLPSTALPSTALPSTVLPSTALPSTALSDHTNADTGPTDGAMVSQALTNPSTSATATATATASATATGVTLAVAGSAVGDVLFDGPGQAIYLFAKETGNRPDCYGACAAAWPPVLTTGAPVAGTGVEAALLGTTARTDGSTQVTLAGHPLYYYAHEGKNEVTCHNVDEFGGLWLAVTAAGAPAAA